MMHVALLGRAVGCMGERSFGTGAECRRSAVLGNERFSLLPCFEGAIARIFTVSKMGRAGQSLLWELCLGLGRSF